MSLYFPSEMRGIRTKKIFRYIKEIFKTNKLIYDFETEIDFMFLFESLGFKLKELNGEVILEALFFFSKNQIIKVIDYYLTNTHRISELACIYHKEILEEKDNSKENLKRWRKFSRDDIKSKDKIKEDLVEILNENITGDIYLFGRMLAGNKKLSINASAQVAHAISTHEVYNEFDYYVGVDDLSNDDETGTAMLGDLGYNSSTLYRYANISILKFYEQVGDMNTLIDMTTRFVKAFVESMPMGKINSYANQTTPQAVVLSLRSYRPLSMADIFEEPIKSDGGYLKKSIIRLFDEFDKHEVILDKPLFTGYLLVSNEQVKNIGKRELNFNNLLEDLGVEIKIFEVVIDFKGKSRIKKNLIDTN